jgi:hypothetical protein
MAENNAPLSAGGLPKDRETVYVKGVAVPSNKTNIQWPTAGKLEGTPYFTASEQQAKDAQSSAMVYAADPNMISQMKDMADTAYKDIQGAMKALVDLTTKDQIDVGSLTSMVKEGFNQTRSMLLSSATASAKKASLEMDAALGSSSMDSRSVVRRNLAASVTNNILSTKQQAIAQLYSGNIDKVADITLKGGTVNAELKMKAAAAIGQLAGDAGNLILGTNNAISGLYSQQMNYAIELMDAHTRRKSIDTQMSIAQMENATRNRLADMGDALERDKVNSAIAATAVQKWQPFTGVGPAQQVRAAQKKYNAENPKPEYQYI